MLQPAKMKTLGMRRLIGVMALTLLSAVGCAEIRHGLPSPAP